MHDEFLAVPVPQHRVAGDLPPLDLLTYLHAGHPGSRALGHGLTSERFALEVIASIASLERAARSQEAAAASGTADEARDARKRAEDLREAARPYVDALPEDWPALLPSSSPVPDPTGSAPLRIGKW